MPHVDHQLRTIIKLAIADTPPAVRLGCAHKRPKAAWQDWEEAKAHMADLIATAIMMHFEVVERDWRWNLSQARGGGTTPASGQAASE